MHLENLKNRIPIMAHYTPRSQNPDNGTNVPSSGFPKMAHQPPPHHLDLTPPLGVGPPKYL